MKSQVPLQGFRVLRGVNLDGVPLHRNTGYGMSSFEDPEHFQAFRSLEGRLFPGGKFEQEIPPSAIGADMLVIDGVSVSRAGNGGAAEVERPAACIKYHLDDVRRKNFLLPVDPL